MRIKSAKWLGIAIAVLAVEIFGFLALAVSQIFGSTGEVQPFILLPFLIFSTVVFWFCCWKAVELQH